MLSAGAAPARGRPSRSSPGRRGFGAVLLDLDGTLIDSNDTHARAWSRALSRFGHRVSASRIRPEIGKGGQELLRDFLPAAERHFLGQALGETQVELFLRAGRRALRPIPGAARAVRSMRRNGLVVILASSADRRVVERALRRLGLTRVVKGFTSADDVAKAKPFDDIFSISIARFGLADRRPVAIGDTPYDIAAAHQIGVPCLAVRSGGFPSRRLSRAEALFADLGDLWARGRHLFA